MFLFVLQVLIPQQTHHRRLKIAFLVYCSLRRESVEQIGQGSYLLEYWWEFSRRFPIDVSADFLSPSASLSDWLFPFFYSWMSLSFMRFWRFVPMWDIGIHRDFWSSCHRRLAVAIQEWFHPQRDLCCRQRNAWSIDELQGKENWWFVWNCTIIWTVFPSRLLQFCSDVTINVLEWDLRACLFYPDQGLRLMLLGLVLRRWRNVRWSSA